MSPRHVSLTATVPVKLAEKSLSILAERGTTWDDFIRLQLKRLTKNSRFYGLKDQLVFGKYRDEIMETVIRTDPDYIAWCLREIDGFALHPEALELLSTTGVEL